MAETENPELEAPEEAPEAEAPRGGRLARLKVVGLVGALVIVECAMAYFLIPSAAETQQATQTALAAESALDAEPTDLLDEPEVDEATVEIELTEAFSVTAYQELSGTTMRVDFRLWGVVYAEDEGECKRLLAEHQNRFREQVIIIIRSAELADLADPGLGLIKRKILEKSNRLLGKPFLQGIVISDFSFVEQ